MSEPHDPTTDPVTPERLVRASWRRIAVLVGGVIVFAICANASALIAIRVHPTNGGHWILRQKWLLLERAPDTDTLVLGDSTCNQGVRPDVLRETLGGTALNLCTIGDVLAVNDAWMLEAYLRSHAKPRRVVVIHTYDMWDRDASDRFVALLGELPLPFGFWNHFDLSLDLSIGQQALVVADRWFPLYSDEKTLRGWLFAPREQLRLHLSLNAEGYMNVGVPKPALVEADARLHQRTLDSPWTPSAINRRALAELVKLAKEHQLELVIAPAPLYEGLWADPRMQARFAEIQTWIRSVVSDAPTVHVLDASPPTFSADQMGNVDHVIDNAAVVYTRWLVGKLRGF